MFPPSKPNPTSNYDPESVEMHFDQFGLQEWNRLVETPVDEVSLYLHTHYLEKYILAGGRILEIGAGAGRFTQILANLGVRILVADISPVQLELNKRHADKYGFSHAVEDWQQLDICNLSSLPAGSFDGVVAYGGPFSYVLDKRDVALNECLRVLKPEGRLWLSVMSLWGSAHRSFDGVLTIPADVNAKIIATGDISPQTWPDRQGNFMHLFRSPELKQWLVGSGLTILALSASNCLSTGWAENLKQLKDEPQRWAELLQMEREACAEAGSLDLGAHIIGVTQKG